MYEDIARMFRKIRAYTRVFLARIIKTVRAETMATLQPNEYTKEYFDGQKATYSHNAGYSNYERWYRKNGAEVGNRQFVVADPDGYLLRFFEDLGSRAAGIIKSDLEP